MTGGASGIGLAMAERFLAGGMKVVIADVEAPALAAAASAGAEATSPGGAPTSRCGPTSRRWPKRRTSATVRARRMQQRRRGDQGRSVGAVARGLAVGDRGRPLGRDPRREGLRPPHAGLWRARARRQHGIDRRAVRVARPSRLQRRQGRRRGAHRDAPPRPRAAGSIGVSVLCPGTVPTRIGESDRNRPDGCARGDGVRTAHSANRRRRPARSGRWPSWSSTPSGPTASGSSPTRVPRVGPQEGRRHRRRHDGDRPAQL